MSKGKWRDYEASKLKHSLHAKRLWENSDIRKRMTDAHIKTFKNISNTPELERKRIEGLRRWQKSGDGLKYFKKMAEINKTGHFVECVVCGKSVYRSGWWLKLKTPCYHSRKCWAKRDVTIISKKISEGLKRAFIEHPEYRKQWALSNHITPNKPEKFLTNLLNQVLPNEYKFVGDGQFIVAGKCPDFVNINGQKKLIELYGDYWHKNEDPKNRINLFKKYGFSTLVVWEKELKDLSSLRDKLVQFNSH